MSGKSSGEGAGARLAVRSVLEDHETASLDLERELLRVSQKLELILKDFTERYHDLNYGVAGLDLGILGIRQQVEGLSELAESVPVLRVHTEFESLVRSVHDLEVWACRTLAFLPPAQGVGL